jgi:hypothetical protein
LSADLKASQAPVLNPLSRLYWVRRFALIKLQI